MKKLFYLRKRLRKKKTRCNTSLRRIQTLKCEVVIGSQRTTTSNSQILKFKILLTTNLINSVIHIIVVKLNIKKELTREPQISNRILIKINQIRYLLRVLAFQQIQQTEFLLEVIPLPWKMSTWKNHLRYQKV